MVKMSCWCINSVMVLDEIVVSVRVCLFSSQDNIVCTVQITFIGCEEKWLNLLKYDS